MKKSDWGNLAIILVVFWSFRVLFLGLPLERDEGAYALEGRGWVKGELTPYVSVFEVKPPLILAVYAVLYKLWGSGAGAIRWGAAVYTSAVVAGFYFWMKQVFGNDEAGKLGMLFAVYMNSITIQAVQFNTEMAVLLFIVMGMNFGQAYETGGKKKYLIWEGIAWGAGLLGKQTLVYPAAVWGLLKIRSREIFFWSTGIILVALLAGGYLAMRGTMNNFIESAVIQARDYTRLAGHSRPDAEGIN